MQRSSQYCGKEGRKEEHSRGVSTNDQREKKRTGTTFGSRNGTVKTQRPFFGHAAIPAGKVRPQCKHRKRSNSSIRQSSCHAPPQRRRRFFQEFRASDNPGPNIKDKRKYIWGKCCTTKRSGGANTDSAMKELLKRPSIPGMTAQTLMTRYSDAEKV